MGKRDIGSWVFTIAIVLVAGFIILRPTKPAPTPALFASGAANLDEAIARAETEGKLVYAFATADWCGPCQSFKKGALSDPGVSAWIEENAVPVYIDVDQAPDDAQRLNVGGIPASYIIKDGEIVSSVAKAISADALLSWLQQSKDAALAAR